MQTAADRGVSEQALNMKVSIINHAGRQAAHADMQNAKIRYKGGECGSLIGNNVVM